jgi:hypothetical protein
LSLPRYLRTAALVAVLLVVVGCGSSATTAPSASSASSTVVASTAPAESRAPAESVSTGREISGFKPGSVAVEVGTHGAGFAELICEETSSGLNVHSGDMTDGELIVLVFRPDGTVSSLYGALRGVIWTVTENPQGTLNADRSGTFSGKDAISGADVSGNFACE